MGSIGGIVSWIILPWTISAILLPDYMNWMLHMSFYVLCGGLVGLVLKERKNTGRRPVRVLSLGCVMIIIAANIVGLGMAS